MHIFDREICAGEFIDKGEVINLFQSRIEKESGKHVSEQDVERAVNSVGGVFEVFASRVHTTAQANADIDYYWGDFDEALKKQVKKREAGYFSPSKSDTGKPKNKEASALSDLDKLTANTLGNYRAKESESDSHIQAFRNQLSGGKALSEEDARALLTSSACAHLSFEEFKRYSIPILGHKAEIVDSSCAASGDDSFPAERIGVTLHIEPPVIDITLTAPSPVATFIVTSSQPDDNGSVQSRFTPWTIPFRCEIPEQETITIQVWPESILGKLWELSGELTPHYPWKIDQMPWFILTGNPPETVPFTLKLNHANMGERCHASISMYIQPWANHNDISDAIRSVQDILGVSRTGGTGTRNMTLLKFVTNRVGCDITRDNPVWNELFEEWNRAHPDMRFTEMRRMRDEYYRAHRRDISSDYGLPRYSEKVLGKPYITLHGEDGSEIKVDNGSLSPYLRMLDGANGRVGIQTHDGKFRTAVDMSTEKRASKPAG